MSVQIIFFGTPSFAVPTLEALVTAGYEIVAVVTQPDKPVGRGLKIEAPPVKVRAEELGLKVLQPVGLNSVARGLVPRQAAHEVPLYDDVLKDLHPTVGVCVAYGKIIPKEILDIFPKGVLNIHPSLLPKYRGPSPIQTAIVNGDKETGVTIMLLDEEMDHGAILAQSPPLRLRGGREGLRGSQVLQLLAQSGAELLLKTLPGWLAGKIAPQPQDHAKATFTKMLEREDGRIDWQKPAEEIERMVRAYDLWPGTWTTWDGKRLKILKVSIEHTTPNPSSERRGSDSISSPASDFSPLPEGGLRGVGGRGGSEANAIAVNCNPGAIILEQIQPEGKKIMTAQEFLRGYPKFLGNILK